MADQADIRSRNNDPRFLGGLTPAAAPRLLSLPPDNSYTWLTEIGKPLVRPVRLDQV
jgi:hypothetical protein